MHFLGHVVSADGIRPDPAKVQLVQDWPAPCNVKQLRSFMGLASYFRKFMQDFATVTAPLTSLFKKDAAWQWLHEHQLACAAVKTALTTAPVLKLPDYQKEFTLVADASGTGIGAVLLQDGCPVAFDGRKLTDAEGKWSPTEQEMLAVVHHVHKWRPYLHEQHFTVVTDHEPNTWFHSQLRLNPRQHRWYEALRTYDFTWQYKPGRLDVADPLSRHPAFSAAVLCATVCAAAMYRSRAQQAATPVHGGAAPVVPAARSAPAAPKGGGAVPAHVPGPPVSPALQGPSTPSADFADSPDATIGKHLLPNSPFNADAQTLLQQICEGYASDPFFCRLETSGTGKHGLSFSDGLWMHAGRVAVPGSSDLRQGIVRKLHCSPYAGHFGVQRTMDLIGRYYWWPGMQEQVATCIRGCVSCQRSKAPMGASAGRLQPLPVPKGCWEEISMDFIGLLPPTIRQVDMVLVVFDRLSKMTVFIPCRSDATAEQTGGLLMQHVFSKHGFPGTVLSDRGPQFTGAWIQSLYRLIGTKQLLTTAYHPQINGQAERVNRTLTEVLRHLVNKTSYDDRDLQLPLVEFAHNNAKNRSTGVSPSLLAMADMHALPWSFQRSL